MEYGKTYIPILGAQIYKSSSLQIKGLLLPVLLIAIDYFAVVGAVGTAYFFRSHIAAYLFSDVPSDFTIPYIFAYCVIPLTYLLFMQFDCLYTRRLLFWQQVEKIFKVSLYAMLFILVVTYLAGSAREISRIFMVMVWVNSFVLLVISKWLSKKVLTIAGVWQIPVVVIGAGKTAELLVNAFKNDSGLGYKIVGLVEDNAIAFGLKEYPVIGSFDKAEEVVQRTGVKDVLIAAPGLEREELLNMVYRLQPMVNNVTFVPDLFGVPVRDIEIDALFDQQTILLKVRNNLALVINRLIKRAFDVLAGSLVFVIASPIFAVIALVVKLNSPGPVLYTGKRLGLEGKEFSCLKFRTMFVESDAILATHLQNDAEARLEWETFAKLKVNDPRVTSIGRFLRRYSLDELPQIFNVLAGDMSLVGPRPYLKREEAAMGVASKTILETRPGITGLWQVSGRNDLDFQQRTSLDAWYVRNWAFWLDIIILFKTVKVVLTGKGAY